MAKMSVVLLTTGFVLLGLGVVAKLFVGIMFSIKPISYVVLGNSCFLLSIITQIKNNK